MTHKQNPYKKQKQRRKIHYYNSLDGRFDEDFYYGFHKHQIAFVIRGKKEKKKKRKKLDF